MATTELDPRTLSEIEHALALRCEFANCLSGGGPASWRIRVLHHAGACEPRDLVICSMCRDGLHRARRYQMECPVHGPLGYSVAAWWTPLGVL